MKPAICNSNKRSPATPDNCPSEYWLVRVNDLSEVGEVSFDHAYILPDNSVWVWSHDESRLVLISGSDDVVGGTWIAKIVNTDGLLDINNGTITTINVSNLINDIIDARIPMIAAGNNVRIDKEANTITINADEIEMFEVVEELPEFGDSRHIFLVPQADNGFIKWAWINDEWINLGILNESIVLDWDLIQNRPTTFPPSIHTHPLTPAATSVVGATVSGEGHTLFTNVSNFRNLVHESLLPGSNIAFAQGGAGRTRINADIDIMGDFGVEVEKMALLDDDGLEQFSFAIRNSMTLSSGDSSVTVNKTSTGFDIRVPTTTPTHQWQDLPFGDGAVAEAPFPNPQIVKINDVVFLQGRITVEMPLGYTQPEPIAHLPKGYRPSQNLELRTIIGETRTTQTPWLGQATIKALSNGNIHIHQMQGNTIVLDGISFPVV